MVYKKRLSFGVYAALLIPILIAGLFFAGLFSFPDLTILNINDKLKYLATHLWEIRRFFNSKTFMCLGWAVVGWVFLCSYIMYHYRDFHSDIENGAEEWADPKEVSKRRANPDESKNRIISRNVMLDTQGDRKATNNNMIVIASSGKYKTTSVVTENLLKSLSSNKIFLDVKGELMYRYGLYLINEGYTVRCLNLKNPEMSDRYNPFSYIENEEDIIKLIANIQQSLTPPDAMKGDPFWDDGVSLYLQSVFFYEWWYAKKEGRTGTFNNVLKLINDEAKRDTSKPVEKGKQPPTLLQLKMDRLAKEDSPDNPAVRDYRKLKEGAAETVRSIIIITNAKLKLCETAALKRIFEDDDLNLREFGTGVGGTVQKPTNKKLALFLCVDDTDHSFNFVCSMLYTQALTILMRMADNDFKHQGGALPIPLELWLDEFYAGARPADAVSLLGVIRSRNISMIPILQSAMQLKDLFPGDKAEIMFDNVPVLLFGGAGQGALQTQKYISELLGNATIDSMSDGKHGSQYNGNYNKKGRELMTPAEIKRMDKKDCIIFMEGERPIFDRKALPWEDRGASRREIRRAKRLKKKNPDIKIPSRLSRYKIAMKLNKESPNGGYVSEAKSMYDPHTGAYVTIKHEVNVVEAENLPENANVIDLTNEEFLYHRLGKSGLGDINAVSAAVSEEIRRLVDAEQKIKKNAAGRRKKQDNTGKAGASGGLQASEANGKPEAFAVQNVTDSVTKRAAVPETIEDGIIKYFNSMSEQEKDMVNKAIENGMPDIFIRQMFTMNLESMQEFYNAYFGRKQLKTRPD